MDFDAFLQRIFLGNTVLAWSIAAAVFAGGLGAVLAVRRVVIGRLGRFAERSDNQIDDLISDLVRRTHFLVVLTLVAAASTLILSLPAGWRDFIRYLVVVALFFQGMSWGNGLVTFWMNRYASRRGMTVGDGASTLAALVFLVRIGLFFVLFLVALENLDIEIAPLIAGLGIGGVAVALAVQNILGDLFAALSIILDKPFAVGDFIIVDQVMGTVEHIGLKSTRLRSLTGEQVIVSNGDLLRARVRNYKRMVERRAVFSLGVVYETPVEKLARIPSIVRDVITGQKLTRFDRCHFMTYGDFSLNFETVYWILSSDYSVYADTQQAINLEIFRRFAAEGIDFAYPTRTILLRGQGDGRAVAMTGA